MKQIMINKNCNGCGMCIVKCPQYFQENDDGDAEVIQGVLADEDATLQAVIAECPVQAISLGQEVDAGQSLREKLDELVQLAKGLPAVTCADVRFDKEYANYVVFPTLGSSRYEYRSASAAQRAGLRDFGDRVYSQIDSQVLRVITEYRIDVIKPYYTTDEDSIYARNNRRIGEVLTAIYHLAGAGRLPADFCTVDVFPERDFLWKMLEKGELIADDFIPLVKREFDYSLSYYESSIDYDDTEDYRGKDVYNYNAFDACRELTDDVRCAVRYAADEIEESAASHMTGFINSYNKRLKTCLDQKIQLVKALI